jgi:hypothetical protein
MKTTQIFIQNSRLGWNSFVLDELYCNAHTQGTLYVVRFVLYSITLQKKKNLFIYDSTVLSLDLGRFFCFLILYTVGRTPKTGIGASKGRYLHTRQHKRRINLHTDIHTSSGIWTHDPSISASEDSSCLRPHGHWWVKKTQCKNITHSLTHTLTHGAEPFLRSCQLCSYSRTSQHFM